MFVRNLLQSGDCATLVPIGIPITLQYSGKGTIQKVYQNHAETDRKELSNSVLEHIIKHKQVPIKIPITGGTSWIQGVLYSDVPISGHGTLPDCMIESLLTQYDEDPESFTFYAGNAESLAHNFNGALSIRQWLTIAKFEVLPGYLISSTLTDENFANLVAKDYPFNFPLIASYIVFRNNKPIYPATGLTTFNVKNIERCVDENGVISVVITNDEDISLNASYFDVADLKITKGSQIICDSEGNFIHCETDSSLPEFVGETTTCSWCGKKLIVPRVPNTVFKCTDPQCNSVLYPRVKQLLQGLELDPMSYDEYVKITNDIGPIFSLPDIFDLDRYKDIQVSLPLTQVVRAIIPKSVLPGQVQITQLCDACSNSVETLTYYVQNVDKLRTELGLDIHTFARLYKWLLNPENSSDVVELLKIYNISYVSSNCKFDGAPIFRGKTIYLTGTFKHGSVADIEAILSSYSASVVSSFSTAVNCVLVGDIEENVNGSAIRQAKTNQIPIFKESPFFAEYDIDKDMAENLK